MTKCPQRATDSIEVKKIDPALWTVRRRFGVAGGHGEGVRLTDSGKRSAENGIQERDRLLARCKAVYEKEKAMSHGSYLKKAINLIAAEEQRGQEEQLVRCTGCGDDFPEHLITFDERSGERFCPECAASPDRTDEE